VKRAIVLTCFLLCSCATNQESKRLATEMATALDAYDAQLSQKIVEQRAYYRRRGEHYTQSRLDLLGSRREQLRARHALEAASDMAASPDTEARAGDLTRFLMRLTDEETELDREMRNQARTADAEFRATLASLMGRKAELNKAREALRQLSTGRRTRAEARAIIEYAAKVKEKLDLE
jgi:hypothetical protein